MSKELKTGIFAVVAIAIFVWGYNFLKGQDIFNPSDRYFFVEYDNISGLNEASVVTINGLKVGKIAQINFNPNPDKKGKLLVKFIVQNKIKFSKNSVAKVASAGFMGGQNLAIIPVYDGEEAVSGDYLRGVVESDFMAKISDNISPKLEHTLVGVDSLVHALNQVLNQDTRESLKKSIKGLEYTIDDVRKTLHTVNGTLSNSKGNIEATMANAKKMTENFAKVSDDLAKANLGATVKKLEATLTNVNGLLADMKSGKGTLGKLMKDDAMYTNLTNASKEMEELLREMKLNPKRFVHFSLFGKKPKPYNAEKSAKNVTNQ